MRTSGAPRTTTGRSGHADPSDVGETPRAAAQRHGQGLGRADADDRPGGTRFRRASGPAGGSRDDGAREPTAEGPSRQGSTAPERGGGRRGPANASWPGSVALRVSVLVPM